MNYLKNKFIINCSNFLEKEDFPEGGFILFDWKDDLDMDSFLSRLKKLKKFHLLVPITPCPALELGGNISSPMISKDGTCLLSPINGQRINSWGSISSFKQFCQRIDLISLVDKMSGCHGVYSLESFLYSNSLACDYSDLMKASYSNFSKHQEENVSYSFYLYQFKKLFFIYLKDSFSSKFKKHLQVEFSKESSDNICWKDLSPLELLEENFERSFGVTNKKDIFSRYLNYYYGSLIKEIEVNQESMYKFVQYNEEKLTGTILSKILKNFLCGQTIMIDSKAFDDQLKEHFFNFLKQNNIFYEEIFYEMPMLYAKSSQGQILIYDSESFSSLESEERQVLVELIMETFEVSAPRLISESPDLKLKMTIGMSQQKGWGKTFSKRLYIEHPNKGKIQANLVLPKGWNFSKSSLPTNQIKIHRNTLDIRSEHSSFWLDFSLSEVNAQTGLVSQAYFE